ASDVIAGCVCGSASFIASLMSLTSGSLMLLGATMNPQVAFNLSARLPHLPLRMREHGQRALLFASRLHALGLPVCYPGLPSHPQAHVLARISNGSRPHLLPSAAGKATAAAVGGTDAGVAGSDGGGGVGMGGGSGGAEWLGPYAGGGMLSLDLGSTAMAYDFMRHLQNNAEFGYMAVSLGFHDSLVSCSGASTSSEMRAEQQQAVGISPGLVRMSVGYTGSEEQRWTQLLQAASAVGLVSALGGSEGRFAARRLMQLAAVLHFTDATIRAHAAALVHRHLVGAQPARAGAGEALLGLAQRVHAWNADVLAALVDALADEALNCILVPAAALPSPLVRAEAVAALQAFALLHAPSSRSHLPLLHAAARKFAHPGVQMAAVRALADLLLWHRPAALLLPDVAAPGLSADGEGSAVSGCSAGGEAQRAGGAHTEGSVNLLLGLVPLVGGQVGIDAAREDVERAGRESEGEDGGEAEGVVAVVGEGLCKLLLAHASTGAGRGAGSGSVAVTAASAAAVVAAGTGESSSIRQAVGFKYLALDLAAEVLSSPLTSAGSASGRAYRAHVVRLLVVPLLECFNRTTLEIDHHHSPPSPTCKPPPSAHRLPPSPPLDLQRFKTPRPFQDDPGDLPLPSAPIADQQTASIHPFTALRPARLSISRGTKHCKTEETALLLLSFKPCLADGPCTDKLFNSRGLINLADCQRGSSSTLTLSVGSGLTRGPTRRLYERRSYMAASTSGSTQQLQRADLHGSFKERDLHGSSERIFTAASTSGSTRQLQGERSTRHLYEQISMAASTSGSTQQLQRADLHGSFKERDLHGSSERIYTAASTSGSTWQLQRVYLHGSLYERIYTAASTSGSTRQLHGEGSTRQFRADLHGIFNERIYIAASTSGSTWQPLRADLHGSFYERIFTAASTSGSIQQLLRADLHSSFNERIYTPASTSGSTQQLQRADFHGSFKERDLHGSFNERIYMAASTTGITMERADQPSRSSGRVFALRADASPRVAVKGPAKPSRDRSAVKGPDPPSSDLSSRQGTRIAVKGPEKPREEPEPPSWFQSRRQGTRAAVMVPKPPSRNQSRRHGSKAAVKEPEPPSWFQSRRQVTRGAVVAGRPTGYLHALSSGTIGGWRSDGCSEGAQGAAGYSPKELLVTVSRSCWLQSQGAAGYSLKELLVTVSRSCWLQSQGAAGYSPKELLVTVPRSCWLQSQGAAGYSPKELLVTVPRSCWLQSQGAAGYSPKELLVTVPRSCWLQSQGAAGYSPKELLVTVPRSCWLQSQGAAGYSLKELLVTVSRSCWLQSQGAAGYSLKELLLNEQQYSAAVKEFTCCLEALTAGKQLGLTGAGKELAAVKELLL
ncbi:unnamed protein product, partial [Closterium sp. Yama58-4]